MSGGGDVLTITMGIATETGRRSRNEDYVGAVLAPSAHGYCAAVADGMGGALGGREAAEVTVRNFLNDYYDTPPTLSVEQAAAKVLGAINSWVFAQGRQDSLLAGMGCTFSGLILRGRSAHVVHVGDSRVYRLTGSRLVRLTEDHVLKQPGLSHVLYRALGIEPFLRLDYARHALELHDRFLLCSDGVHGVLDDRRLADVLNARTAPELAARELVAAAIAAGSTDNASAVVVDIVGIPAVEHSSLMATIAPLEIGALPKPGDNVDGFVIDGVLSDGRYSRLFRATDSQDQMPVVLKFPHPRVIADDTYKAAFLREAWVSSQVTSPYVGKVIPAQEGKQTRLYTIMPFYVGETLEQRLLHPPKLALAEGLRIGTDLCKAVVSLHRRGIIHRDIKPDNIILDPLTLIDLGVARILGQEDGALGETHPGTASYMAPEIFRGQVATEQSDVFAIGVTLFRALTGKYPYGEIEPFSHPRFAKMEKLTKLRPDLPGWLETVLAKAMAVSDDDRYQDAIELLFALETGPSRMPVQTHRRVPLYDRHPLRFWQGVAALLLIALIWSLKR